jgi:hypothetical protein
MGKVYYLGVKKFAGEFTNCSSTHLPKNRASSGAHALFGASENSQGVLAKIKQASYFSRTHRREKKQQ